MTIHDPTPDSVLLSRFQALSIDKPPDICDEDDILSDAKILAVYQSKSPC